MLHGRRSDHFPEPASRTLTPRGGLEKDETIWRRDSFGSRERFSPGPKRSDSYNRGLRCCGSASLRPGAAIWVACRGHAPAGVGIDPLGYRLGIRRGISASRGSDDPFAVAVPRRTPCAPRPLSFTGPSWRCVTGTYSPGWSRRTAARSNSSRCPTPGSIGCRPRSGSRSGTRSSCPRLLPEVDRVLYVDVDAIVVDSLDELFEIDWGGNYVGAVTNVLRELLRPPPRRARSCRAGGLLQRRHDAAQPRADAPRRLRRRPSTRSPAAAQI